MKQAMLLEDDENYQAAEEEFIKANKPKEAIDMYVHLHDWASSIRIAEQYEPAAVVDVYVAQAKVCESGDDFRGAEDLYLAASKPELALQMYQQAEMWSEALRLAQQHLPHRVTEVNSAYQSSQSRTGKGGTKGDYLSSGRQLEQQKQWNQAVDAYLNAKRGKLDSVEDLEELWDRAIEVARNHVPNRHVEVALEVSKRLIDLKRDESAADVLFEIGRHDEAISVCLNARKYEKAKALSQGNATLRRRVDEAYQGHLVSKEDTSELMDIGRSDVALDVLAKKGDWERVWEVAAKEKMSSSAVAKYVLMCVEEVSEQFAQFNFC
jgi:intraflagellar transport protein 172